MDKKYELVPTDRLCWKGLLLYRIRALKDFADVKAGDLGGYIQNEDMLSQIGNCWIYDDAKVFGLAVVKEDATVRGDSEIYGWTVLEGSSKIVDQKIYTPRPSN